MKRDDDYFRSLLISLEENEQAVFIDPHHMNMNAEESKRHNHIQLGIDAGLLATVGRGTFRITNQGHDYLAAIKDDGIWNQTKSAVAETGGSASLEILKQLATGFIKQKISKHTGIEL